MYFYYVLSFALLIWLYNVYNTSGIFSEKRMSAIELYSVELVKRSKNGVEWVLNADKLVKDESYNRNYFTNINFMTDPSSDSVQLIKSREAMQDGNLKLINFSGNVHARNIYPDTGENVLKNIMAPTEMINMFLDTSQPASFFERGRPRKFLEDNFYADSLEYYYEHKIIISRSPVRLVKPKMEVTGNSMENNMREKRGKVVGNVKIIIHEYEEGKDEAKQ